MVGQSAGVLFTLQSVSLVKQAVRPRLPAHPPQGDLRSALPVSSTSSQYTAINQSAFWDEDWNASGTHCQAELELML